MPVMYVGLILTVTLALNLSIAEAGDSGHRNPHQPSGICWLPFQIRSDVLTKQPKLVYHGNTLRYTAERFCCVHCLYGSLVCHRTCSSWTIHATTIDTSIWELHAVDNSALWPAATSASEIFVLTYLLTYLLTATPDFAAATTAADIITTNAKIQYWF